MYVCKTHNTGVGRPPQRNNRYTRARTNNWAETETKAETKAENETANKTQRTRRRRWHGLASHGSWETGLRGALLR